MATDTNDRGEPEPDAAATPAANSGDRDGGNDDARIAAAVRPLESLPPEVLENLPPEVRAHLTTGGSVETHTSITSMSMLTLGKMVNPLADKVTEQHVSDIIHLNGREAEYADRQSEREYSDRKHARNWGAVLAVVIVLAITAIAIILIYQGLLTFLQEMALYIIPALGGVGVGIVIGIRMGIRYANTRGRQ